MIWFYVVSMYILDTEIMEFLPENIPLYVVWPGNRNIVSTVNLDCKLELKAIALQARNAEYNPKVGLLV